MYNIVTPNLYRDFVVNKKTAKFFDLFNDKKWVRGLKFLSPDDEGFNSQIWFETSGPRLAHRTKIGKPKTISSTFGKKRLSPLHHIRRLVIENYLDGRKLVEFVEEAELAIARHRLLLPNLKRLVFQDSAFDSSHAAGNSDYPHLLQALESACRLEHVCFDYYQLPEWAENPRVNPEGLALSQFINNLSISTLTGHRLRKGMVVRRSNIPHSFSIASDALYCDGLCEDDLPSDFREKYCDRKSEEWFWIICRIVSDSLQSGDGHRHIPNQKHSWTIYLPDDLDEDGGSDDETLKPLLTEKLRAKKREAFVETTRVGLEAAFYNKIVDVKKEGIATGLAEKDFQDNLRFVWPDDEAHKTKCMACDSEYYIIVPIFEEDGKIKLTETEQVKSDHSLRAAPSTVRGDQLDTVLSDTRFPTFEQTLDTVLYIPYHEMPTMHTSRQQSKPEPSTDECEIPPNICSRISPRPASQRSSNSREQLSKEPSTRTSVTPWSSSA